MHNPTIYWEVYLGYGKKKNKKKKKYKINTDRYW